MRLLKAYPCYVASGISQKKTLRKTLTMFRIGPMLICVAVIMIAASMGLQQNYAQPNDNKAVENKAAQNNMPAQKELLLSDKELKQLEVYEVSIMKKVVLDDVEYLDPHNDQYRQIQESHKRLLGNKCLVYWNAEVTLNIGNLDANRCELSIRQVLQYFVGSKGIELPMDLNPAVWSDKLGKKMSFCYFAVGVVDRPAIEYTEIVWSHVMSTKTEVVTVFYTDAQRVKVDTEKIKLLIPRNRFTLKEAKSVAFGDIYADKYEIAVEPSAEVKFHIPDARVPDSKMVSFRARYNEASSTDMYLGMWDGESCWETSRQKFSEVLCSALLAYRAYAQDHRITLSHQMGSISVVAFEHENKVFVRLNLACSAYAKTPPEQQKLYSGAIWEWLWGMDPKLREFPPNHPNVDVETVRLLVANGGQNALEVAAKALIQRGGNSNVLPKEITEIGASKSYLWQVTR